MEYETFEGVIPEGEYGAGPVIVWDRGTYVNLTQRDGREVPASRALRDGHFKVWLEGRKLQGGYALTRAQIGGGDRAKWLLVKLDDEGADRRRNPVSSQPRSVISNRTVEELAERPRKRARGRTA
jgi:ATP-dependent DNA ligase